jgi:para-nitrobenzyl esterase
MAQNPSFVKRWFGFLPRIRDRELYTRTAAYISDQWKLSAVNEPATLISTAGGAPVYTYRWDWDEQPQGWLLDGPTLLGAAHGFEIPFVMGQFDSLPIPYTYTEGNREPRERLSRQMMSYWAEFAYSGRPGRGRGGELPEWPAWQGGKGATMILDTDADGGLRAEPDTLDAAALKQRLFEDPVIARTGTLCSLYQTLFLNSYRGAHHWDAEEYLALGCELPGA